MIDNGNGVIFNPNPNPNPNPRYENGLTKLLETAAQVNTMQIELEELQPKLKEATIATDRLVGEWRGD